MGADWYTPFVLFGCSVHIPAETPFSHILRALESMTFEEPFQVCSMLSEFHSRMEGMSTSEYNDMVEYATIVLGFCPTTDMLKNHELANKLKDILSSEGLCMYSFHEPTFHTGIDWSPYDE